MSLAVAISKALTAPLAIGLFGVLAQPAFAELDLTAPTLDSRITYTRASTQTYTGIDAQLYTAAINECPLEYDPATARTNYARPSSNLSAWSLNNAPVLTANAGVAPDGTTTATLMSTNGTSSGVYKTSQLAGLATGVTCTFSLYVKAGTGSASPSLRLGMEGTAFPATAAARFNPITGAVVSGAFANAPVYAGNGWWRFSVTGTTTAAGNVNITVYGNNDAFSVYVWGAQLELSAAATAYIPTSNASVTKCDPIGRSFWEARTNTLFWSSDFTQSSWQKTGLGAGSAPAVTGAAGIAPDGTNTACRVQFTLNGGAVDGDQSFINQAQTTVTNSSYAQSVWMRSNDGANHIVQLSFYGASPILATVTPTWQRFTNVAAAIDTGRGFRLGLRGSTVANQPADILVWGAQQELGLTPSPFIPTTSAQVTRAATVATVDDLSKIKYNPAQGTLYVEAMQPYGFSASKSAASLNDGTNVNRLTLYRQALGPLNAFMLPDNVAVGSGVNYTPGVVWKQALTYVGGVLTTTANGASIHTGAYSVNPAVLNQLAIGDSYGTGPEYLHGYIRRIRYYPRALSNNQLKAITA